MLSLIDHGFLTGAKHPMAAFNEVGLLRIDVLTRDVVGGRNQPQRLLFLVRLTDRTAGTANRSAPAVDFRDDFGVLMDRQVQNARDCHSRLAMKASPPATTPALART